MSGITPYVGISFHLRKKYFPFNTSTEMNKQNMLDTEEFYSRILIPFCIISAVMMAIITNLKQF